MAHFARIDNNVVRRVIVISDDRAPDPAPDNEQQGQAFIADVLGLAGEWKQTSYNTHGNQHLDGGTPFRGNYAGIGYTYDPDRDAFIPPEPPDAIGFDEATVSWIVPDAEPEP